MHNRPFPVLAAAAVLAGCSGGSVPGPALDLPGADQDIARIEAETRFTAALFRHREGAVLFTQPGFAIVSRPELPGFEGIVAERERDSGTLSVTAYTDIEPGDDMRDPDFLVFGHWSHETGAVPAEAEVFGYGTVRPPYDAAAAAAALTGTVRFDGHAAGLYTDGAAGGSFVASAVLVADLGSGSDLGTIAGTIDGFVDGNGDSLGEWIVDLGLKSLEYSERWLALGIDNGEYLPDRGASAAFGDVAGRAGWRGELYGLDGPSAVAGTFWANAAGGPRLAGGFAARAVQAE